MSPRHSLSRRTVARNRKARRQFEVLERMEAGIALEGPEVKSIRAGNVAFGDAYAAVEGGELWLRSFHVSPYRQAGAFNPDPLRPRRLLMRRHEIRRLGVAVEEKGLTIVPLEIYLVRGLAKVELGLARGRKLHDKRELLKRRQQELEARRAIKEQI